MLTKLHFKNWRSLRDVEIDLTPITVFIGANASGKTNILDGLYFLQAAVNDGMDTALQERGFEDKIRTLGSLKNSPITIEMSFQSSKGMLNYTLTDMFSDDGMSSWIVEKLTDDAGKIWLKSDMGKVETYQSDQPIIGELSGDIVGLSAYGRVSTFPHVQIAFQFIAQHWQMLDEGFNASIYAVNGSDPYLIDPCADNLPVMLEFMQKRHPESYSQLRSDLSWLLTHVSDVQTFRDELGTRFALQEASIEAPTISSGTGRIVAMLTAFYALDMRLPEFPGLVVIEEPDTALNPGLLRKLVGKFREFVDGEHPRQLILTTHNPALLNYFEPEEVRIVERDEEGYTRVRPVPDYIKDIWLDEYRLGEVWMTNAFEGLAE